MSVSSPLRNVALIGAGGNLGSHVLRAFCADPSFNITVITRQSSQSRFSQPGINVIKVEDRYVSEDLIRAFKNQDAVICMLGFRADAKAQYRIIDAALQAGVKRYIPADFGANAEHPGLLDVDIRSLGNAEIIKYLRSKQAEGLTWTCLITGLFIDMALPNGFMGYNLKEKKATIWDTGDSSFSCSTRPWIADAVVALLKKAKETANRVIFTSQYETSQNQILDHLQEITGTTWETQSVDSKDMTKEGREQWAKGDFIGAGKLALAALYSENLGSDFRKSGRLNNDLLGLDANPKQALPQLLSSML